MAACVPLTLSRLAPEACPGASFPMATQPLRKAPGLRPAPSGSAKRKQPEVPVRTDSRHPEQAPAEHSAHTHSLDHHNLRSRCYHHSHLHRRMEEQRFKPK